MSPPSIERFRALFAEEADVRLTRLNELVLDVEGDGADATTVAEIFREIHTLKGGAAVVGFDELSRFTHCVEERLEDLRTGPPFTAPLVDALVASVDGLGQLVTASVAGHHEGELVAMVAILERSLTSPERSPRTRPDTVDQGLTAVSRRAVPMRSMPATDGEPVVPVAAPVAAERRPRATAPKVPLASRGSILVPVERLEELVRLVGEAASSHLRVGKMMHDRVGVDPSRVAELTELSRLLNDLQDKAMRTQMVPVATVTDQLHRAVRDLARAVGKEVRWQVTGEQTELERNVLQAIGDSLVHVVRNAVDHGIEAPEVRRAAGKPGHGTVRLHAAQLGSEVIITVSDDGQGIDAAAVRVQAAANGVPTDGLSDAETLQLVFHSGLSTARSVTTISGRGVGLDVVHASVEAARGRVEIESEPGLGTVLRLVVPITLAVLSCLLVESTGQRYALPLHRVVVAHAPHVAVSHGEGRDVLWVNAEPVPVTALADALGHGGAPPATGPIVVVNGILHRHAFQVDALVGHRDVVVKGLSGVLPRLDVVAGTSIDPDGSVLVVLDPPGLVAQARHAVTQRATSASVNDAAPRAQHILVVDDALTVRELQRSILERAGFEVSVSSDGLEALARLALGGVDLVLTDVQMPHMDGFALTRAIRHEPAHANLPVLIVTTLDGDQDRQEGLDAGADGYIVKASFDEQSLLAAVRRVLGVDP